MITEKKGDITQVTEGVILHCVNCQGVMGSGVALAIRNKWPQVYEDYRTKWRGHKYQGWSGELLGKMTITRAGTLIIASLFGQDQYGTDGKKYVSYDALDTALETIGNAIAAGNAKILRDGTPIHFPLIGCGLAGGHWPIVREIIEHRLPDGLGPKYLWTL